MNEETMSPEEAKWIDREANGELMGAGIPAEKPKETQATKQSAKEALVQMLKVDREACLAKIKAACDEHNCDPSIAVTFSSVTGTSFHIDVVNRREG